MKILIFVLLALLASTAASFGVQDNFSTIDRHALAAPANTTTKEELVKYLSDAAKNETEVARAIFRWITENIAYDVESLESGTYGKQNVDDILRSRKGVCSEYSHLFTTLARQAGLEAETVIGFSKGPGFSSDSVASDPDHAWNVTKLDGQWHLLDCTWAAGYVDVGGKFVRKLFDHYFLTQPDQFIYDHMPEDSKWQLTDNPVSRKEFENMVYLRPGFFRNKLTVISNEQRDIVSNGNVDLIFGGPNDAQMNAEVSRGRDRDSSCQSFVQKDGGKFKVSTVIPKTGKYTLRLYAKRGDEGNRFEWAADYCVNVTKTDKDLKSMPTAFSTFYEKNAVLHSPMYGTLENGSIQKFSISTPGADIVNVIVNEKWIRLQKDGELYEGEVDVKGDVVQLVAKYPENDSSYVLLKYKVD